MATGLTPEKQGITLSCDHIRPRADFPHLELEISNIQVIELGLNRTKSNVFIYDWRPFYWKWYYSIIRYTKILLCLLIIVGIIYGHIDYNWSSILNIVS
jgi:hypothetical protein